MADGAVTGYAYTYYSVGGGANTQTATLGSQFKRTTLDGFGRTTRVENGSFSGSTYTTVNQVDTQYAPCGCSPLGKMSAVSQPYAPGPPAPTIYWTTYAHDPSGRTLTVTQPNNPDNGNVSWGATSYTYQGNTTTVTDPAGKWKSFTSDAFGNLTVVTEPNPAGGSNYTTTYTYDLFGDVTGVSMPRGGVTQTRSFTWAYPGKLASSTNPENGTVTISVADAGGRLTQRLDAKNQKATYTYDSYGRLTDTHHFTGSGSPPFYSYTEDTTQHVHYYYDSTSNPTNGSFTQNGWGRLTGVTFQNESFLKEPLAYYYSYNQAGRVIDQQLQFDFNGYQTQGSGQPG